MDAEQRRSERDGEQSAAVLRDRLRRCDLSPERLELAAVLGFQPAREALGQEEPFVPFATPRDLARALKPFGEQAWLRAAALLLRDQERILRELALRKSDLLADAFAQERAAIQDYLRQPNTETRARLLEATSGASPHPPYASRIAKRHDAYGPSDPAALNRAMTETLMSWALGSD